MKHQRWITALLGITWFGLYPPAVAQEAASAPLIPTPILYQLLTAELALNRNDLGLAWQLYAELAETTSDPGIAERATRIALSTADASAALKPALSWVAKEPNKLDAQLIVSVLLSLENRLPEATAHLAKALELEPANLETLITYYRQFDAGEKPLAKQVIEQLAKQFPKNALANVILADLAFSKGDFKETKKRLSPILALKNYPEEADLLHVYLLREENRLPEAAKFMQQRLKIKPALHQLRAEYFALLLEMTQPKTALKQLDLLLKERNLAPSMLVELGRQAMEMGWYTQAKKALLIATGSRDHLDISSYFLGRVFELEKASEDAISWFKRVETGPFHVIAHIRAALILNNAGNYDEAILLLNHTFPSDDIEQKQLYLTASEILFTAKRYADGIKLMDEALQLFGQDLDVLYARSLHAEGKHDFKSAEHDLKTILTVDPKQVDSLNALGYLLTNYTNRYSEALDYLNKAYKLDPENPIVMDSLGWLYVKKGDFSEALRWLKEAFKRYPTSEIAAHLGEALWRHGEKTKAEHVLRAALSKNPKDPMLIETMGRLLSPTDPF